MRLRVTCVLDTYDFLPSDVVSLERYGALPLFYSGVRIAHARPDYPSKIIFWCPGNPEVLISGIREAGFLPTAPASSAIQRRGIPLRWSAIILFILIWNGLFLLNDKLQHGSTNRAGPFMLAPLLFAGGLGILLAAMVAGIVVSWRKATRAYQTRKAEATAYLE